MKYYHLILQVILACCVLLAGSACSAQDRASQKPRTEVILLGTGTPYPNPKAQGPATAIIPKGTNGRRDERGHAAEYEDSQVLGEREYTLNVHPA